MLLTDVAPFWSAIVSVRSFIFIVECFPSQSIVQSVVHLIDVSQPNNCSVSCTLDWCFLTALNLNFVQYWPTLRMLQRSMASSSSLSSFFQCSELRESLFLYTQSCLESISEIQPLTISMNALQSFKRFEIIGSNSRKELYEYTSDLFYGHQNFYLIVYSVAHCV